MDLPQQKRTAQWFRERYFPDEPLPVRKTVSQALPSLLRTARSLEATLTPGWQSREALFLKQGKLLAEYEDTYEYTGTVVRYYPTYQSLTDQELRGYFSWRSKLRRGQWEKAPATFAYLYIYELLNRITVSTPREGYEKLLEFREHYGPLDGSILYYLDRWTQDFVILQELEPSLLEASPRVRYHRQLAVFQDLSGHTPERIMEAVTELAPKWLRRSKFYAEHRQAVEQVLPAVLLRMQEHYRRGKRPLMQQLFGSPRCAPIIMMEGAVYYRSSPRDQEYTVDPLCTYRCQGRLWTVEEYPVAGSCLQLEELAKAVDAELRLTLRYGHPIQYTLKHQWLRKVLQEEIGAYLQRKKDAEAKKLKLDFSQLEGIRRNAEVTRDALLVEEELWDEPEEAAPEPEPEGCLPPKEYRLLQCLLYGYDLGWIQTQGLMLSVLLDSINELLYDTFLDTVLEPEGRVVEDYVSDLKEMILP